MKKTLVVLVAVAAAVAMVSLRAANTFTLVGGGSSPIGTGDTFDGMSPDASRIYFETTEQLLPGDTDSTYDVYRWAGGVITQVSLGNGNNGFLTDAAFLGESADGSRAYFQTRESLSASDTDAEMDIYQNAGGVITLLSGTGGWPVAFKGAYGTTVFFETPDALESGDTDTGVDVYASSGGAPALVSVNTDTDAYFKAASANGGTVIIQTDAAIDGSDTNGVVDLYRLQGGAATLLTTGSDFAPASFVGASTDLSRVFFQTSGQLDSHDTDYWDDIYESYAGQITLISGTTDDHLVQFKGASADGTRVFLSAEKPLAPGEADDGGTDIYEVSGGVITLLSGSNPSPVQFNGSSVDGTRVFFSTSGALAGDVDATQDVYEASGGVITLLSGGSAVCSVPSNLGTCHAFFAGASADGTKVLIQSNESLTADDTDGGQTDYFVSMGGVLTLRTPGGGIGGAELGAAGSYDMSVVVFTTIDAVTAADQDTSADIYRSVASGPSPDVTPPAINCAAADGLWHADNVTLACTATDTGSGLLNPADASFSLSTTVGAGVEDANAFTGSRQVSDVAGNTAVAQVGGNRIDRKAPSVTVTTPAAGAVYSQGQAVLASYGCVDGGSGVATCTGPVASGQPIDTASTGAKIFSVAGTDSVGNGTSVDVSYSVVGGTIAPVFSGFPSVFLPVLISNCGTSEFPTACPGDQWDPHVDGDIASYTADAKIRHFDFVTGNDVQVPSPAGAQDLLSDVSVGKVVFTRVDVDGRIPVLVYDIANGATTEISPVPAPIRIGSAIGGNTVAYIDQALSAEGELVVAGVSANPGLQLTADSRTERAPSVSQVGDRIVYESCAVQCDIHQAVRTGSSWAVSAVTSNAEPEANPDTDGVLIVYNATRGGERDIYWQPVGGGVEQWLVMSGVQSNPAISGGLIVFDSVAVGQTQSDLFVYHVATNRLFQITSTPVDEVLSDVSALPDGRFRLVWAQGPVGDHDVIGATIELPPLVDDYQFGGFLPPVNGSALNTMKAGGAVPVKFSLGGNRGLNIFAAGYPTSQGISCSTSAPQDPVEQIVTAGGSGLTYDATTDTYSYIWKTSKTWAGTCRELVMRFTDGDEARASFMFK